MCMPLPVPERRRTSSPLRRQDGMTLIELIVAIVIISVGVAGILSAFNVSVRGSADPIASKQLIAVAETLLEEVQQAAFTYCDPDDANVETATGAADCATVPEGMGPEAGDARPFDNINDYNGLNLATITDVAGVAVPYLSGYSAAVTVAPVALNGITVASGDALLIRVTATAPNGQTFTLDGYRTRYAPNAKP